MLLSLSTSFIPSPIILSLSPSFSPPTPTPPLDHSHKLCNILPSLSLFPSLTHTDTRTHAHNITTSASTTPHTRNATATTIPHAYHYYHHPYHYHTRHHAPVSPPPLGQGDWAPPRVAVPGGLAAGREPRPRSPASAGCAPSCAPRQARGCARASKRGASSGTPSATRTHPEGSHHGSLPPRCFDGTPGNRWKSRCLGPPWRGAGRPRSRLSGTRCPAPGSRR